MAHFEMLVQRYRDKSKEVFQQKANSAGGFCLALRMSRTVGASTWPTRSLCQLMLLNHLMGKDEELYWSIIQRVGRKLNDLWKSSKGTQTVQTSWWMCLQTIKVMGYQTWSTIHCSYLWCRTSLIPFLVFPNLWPGLGLRAKHIKTLT